MPILPLPTLRVLRTAFLAPSLRLGASSGGSAAIPRTRRQSLPIRLPVSGWEAGVLDRTELRPLTLALSQGERGPEKVGLVRR